MPVIVLPFDGLLNYQKIGRWIVQSHAGIIRRHRNGVLVGMKLFSCNKCEYKCATAHNLTVHNRNHTRVKPFSCTLCPYRASVASSFRRYMKNKHSY